MTSKTEREDLIRRYLHAVGGYLPSKNRHDVEAELESLINDSLDEELAEVGPGSNAVATVLKKFGPPREVAQRFSPRPMYLIGPGLYQPFLLVCKVLLGVAAGIPLLLLLVKGMAGAGGVSEMMGIQALSEWFHLSFRIALGGLTSNVIVFAILDRLGVQADIESKDWNPLVLPPVEDRERVSLVQVTLKSYAVILLLILFNLYPDWLGIYYSNAETGWNMIPLSDLGVKLPILALNLWWLSALGMNIWLLKKQRWTPLIRWYEFGLGLFAAGILLWIIFHVRQVLETDSLSDVLASPELAFLLGQFVIWFLVISFLIEAGSSGFRLYKLIRKDRPA